MTELPLDLIVRNLARWPEDGRTMILDAKITATPLDRWSGTDLIANIDHETIPVEGLVRWSFTGEIYDTRRVESRCIQAGAIFGGPRNTWPEWPESIQPFVELATRWHLNDIRPGCAHQRAAEQRLKLHNARDLLVKVHPCPVTGYKWGHAWLYESPPPDLEQQIRDALKMGES